MIVDAILGPLLAAAAWVLDFLPDGSPLDLPGWGGATTMLAKINSVLPIGPVIGVAIALLSALAVFIVVRLILVIINIVWW